MRNCWHNDQAALHNRYLKETQNDVCYDETTVGSILDDLAVRVRQCNGDLIKPLTLAMFMESRKGTARKRYDEAVTKMLRRGFDPMKDSDIKAFIKNEKYAEMKPPRAIMGRNPIFNLIYGRYTLALEKIMSKLPCFAKGKDYFERGAWMDKYYGNSRFISGDYSKFESSQREKLLRDIELGLWKRVLSPADYEMACMLFETKLVKSGFTGNGIRFSFFACRGSGDMDTGLFNTIINYVACRYFEIKNGLGTYDFIVDGDDSVVAYPINHTNPINNTFVEFGLDAKLDPIDDPNRVEFCSAKFIPYAPGQFVLCPDIRKICRNIGVLINPQFNHAMGQYYYTLGFMYITMFPGIEFFQRLGRFLMGITRNPKLRVNLELMGQLNPSFIEAFRKCESRNAVRYIDDRLVTVGMWLAFNMQQAELSAIYQWFETVHIDVRGHDKRFRKRGVQHATFDDAQLYHVQVSMEARMRLDYQRILARNERMRAR